MRDLLPCPPCGRQGRPGQGFLAGSNTKEPRGSAPRERDHRGGDHPVPSRTRQLSPPSPRVLQRKAAGGQGVALAEGAFLYARFRARGDVRRRAGSAGRGPQGDVAPAGPFCVMGCRPPYPASSEVAPFRLAVIAAAMRRARRRAAEGAPPRLFSSQRGGKIDSMVLAAQRRRRARSGNLPLCGPFLRYEVQRCLPDALLVLSEVVLI